MEAYEALLEEIASCKACRLCETRQNTVPGEGNTATRLMIIGEGPGAQEDELGRPFVGRAGQLLDKMLDAIEWRREQVYIANIVKCRPPENRAPKEDEVQACRGFLLRQIALINPEIILLMGATALNHMMGAQWRITKDRGKWMDLDGRAVLATFHPAYLLRDPRERPLSFEDLLMIKQRLGKGE